MKTKQEIQRKRIVDAIHGAFVADAASLGTHWYYDMNELNRVIPDMDAPEFRNPPAPQFYSKEEFPGHYDLGMLSPYGEQLLFVADYVASRKEIEGGSMSLAMLDWATSFGGRLDHATKIFVENMSTEDGKWPKCGADDNQAHIYTKVVPVTCLYMGRPERRAMVEEAIRVHQNNDEAVAFGEAASRLLEGVLLGMPMTKVLEEISGDTSAAVKDAFATASNASDSNLTELLGEVGRHCGLPASFIGPSFQIVTSNVDSSLNAYRDAVRENIRAGGDTCGRAIFIGSIFAAAHGGPPRSWLDELNDDVLKRVEAVATVIGDSSIAKSHIQKRSVDISSEILLVCALGLLSFFFIHAVATRRVYGRHKTR